jgi:hypothetical protein
MAFSYYSTIKENMRLLSPNLPDEVKNEIALFSKWTLDIGEGKIEDQQKMVNWNLHGS